MIIWVILYIFLICATILDCHSGRIPNILVCTALLVGGVWYGRSGWQELFLYGIRLIGFLLPFLLFFFLRMLGGGDVKVIAVIGGLVGVKVGVVIVFLSFIVASVVAFIKMICYGVLKERMRILIRYIERIYYTKRWIPYPITLGRESYKIRLSVFFLIGSCLYCMFQYVHF